MKSNTLPIYKKWLETAAVPEVAFVDAVYEMCERNYEAGGDVIVECFGPEDILNEFIALGDVKEYCGLRVEQSLNCRYGDDDDPELITYENYKNWK